MLPQTPLPKRFDLVVIGGSAGALAPLTTILGSLDADFAAAILVVTHRRGSEHASRLPSILGRACSMDVVETANGMLLKPGRVHIARPDRHLAFQGDRIEEREGPPTRHWRPAIDDVFASAAQTFKNRLIAIILSGALDDGVEGIKQVWRHGGITFVQDPGEAEFSSMPHLAIWRDHPNIVAPADTIGSTLSALVSEKHTVALAGPDGVTMKNQKLTG